MSAEYSKQQVGRAAAVLTTSEVAGTALKLDRVRDKRVSVDFTFTLGSLTNVVVLFYVSMDGTTYEPLYDGATALTETLTADGERAYQMPQLAGWKYFRASVNGTGTVTGSSCAFTYRYDKRYPY